MCLCNEGDATEEDPEGGIKVSDEGKEKMEEGGELCVCDLGE